MANLAASAVTINASYNTGEFFGARQRYVNATCVLTGQGGATNKIPASVFGLSKIRTVLLCVGSDNVIYVAAPLYDESGVGISLVNGASGAPADLTATVRLVVTGNEATS